MVLAKLDRTVLQRVNQQSKSLKPPRIAAEKGDMADPALPLIGAFGGSPVIRGKMERFLTKLSELCSVLSENGPVVMYWNSHSVCFLGAAHSHSPSDESDTWDVELELY